MKKTLLGCSSLIIALASFLSLGADIERVKLSVLGKHINVGELLKNAGKAVFKGKLNNDQIIAMLVDSIKVGELPIDVIGDPNATIQDYFDTARVKEFMKNIFTDLANKSLNPEKLGGYLGTIREGIFKGKKGIPNNVGQDEAQRNVLFLDNLKEYLTSGLYKQLSFLEFIDAHNGIPKFLDTIIQGYFDLKGARTLFQNPSQISVDTIFTYINFELLFRDKPTNRQQLSQGLKLSIEDLITFIGKPQKNASDFFKLLKALI
jgi:hypothetical protein